METLLKRIKREAKVACDDMNSWTQQQLSESTHNWSCSGFYSKEIVYHRSPRKMPGREKQTCAHPRTISANPSCHTANRSPLPSKTMLPLFYTSPTSPDAVLEIKRNETLTSVYLLFRPVHTVDAAPCRPPNYFCTTLPYKIYVICSHYQCDYRRISR